MNLSSDLIDRFVKATKDNKKAKGESTVYGTTVEANGSMYVRIDGAETLTPVTATADVVAGERVIVMIKNHTATITGNITSPAARVGDTTSVGEAAINAAEVAVAAANAASEAASKATDAAKTATNFIEHDAETETVLVGNKSSGAFYGFRTKLTYALFAVLNAAGTALLSVSNTLITIGTKYTNVTIKGVEFGSTDISSIGDGTLTGAIAAANQNGGSGGSGEDGEDGVGVESIEQTTTSTEDGGSNIITATLTDGTKSTFTIKNGSKGSKGDKGDQGTPGEDGSDGVGIQSVEQTTTSSEPGGANTVTFTLTDGTAKTFTVKNGLGTSKIVEIPLADYEALSDADKNAEDIVYFIPDGEADGMLRSNLLVPDYANAQDITSPFTAPGAGYVMITALASRAEGGLIAYVYPTVAKESEVLISSQTYTNAYASNVIPLAEGNHIVFSINDGTIKTAKWVPAKNVVDGNSLALGNTDISGIGDGTVTGAIGALNDGLTTRFTYILRSSTVSFKDADNATNTMGYAGVLDVLHSNIGNYGTQAIHTFYASNNGPGFFVMLGKLSNIYYAGQIWSYSIPNGSVYFTYTNGTFNLFTSSQMDT